MGVYISSSVVGDGGEVITKLGSVWSPGSGIRGPQAQSREGWVWASRPPSGRPSASHTPKLNAHAQPPMIDALSKTHWAIFIKCSGNNMTSRRTVLPSNVRAGSGSHWSDLMHQGSY